MTSELTASARPRPLRVAFLIQEGEHSAMMLDGIFADCYSRWGGRFNLLVPCVDGKISPAYWPWLEAYDADIIYSYVPLGRDDILEIYERLCPSFYKFHEWRGEPRLDLYGFKPDYGFTPLSSLSTIFRQARFGFPFKAAPTRIIDRQHGRPSRWLTDNLGSYMTCRGNGMFPIDALSVGSLLVVYTPEDEARPDQSIPPNSEPVSSELDAFAEFTARQATSMSVISLQLAPKLDIEHGAWSRSFNLVVGTPSLTG